MTDDTAQILATLDEHDLDRGRAPHPGNPAAAERLARRRAPYRCPACFRRGWTTWHGHADGSEIVWCHICSASIEARPGHAISAAALDGWTRTGVDVWQCRDCAGKGAA